MTRIKSSSIKIMLLSIRHRILLSFDDTIILPYLDSSTVTSLDQSISNNRVSGQFLLQCFIDIPLINTNSVGHDQMPCFVASDLDLH